MQRTITDWGGNIVAYAVMIVLNVLSNALPINDQSMPEISARYASLFTPAGFTFVHGEKGLFQALLQLRRKVGTHPQAVGRRLGGLGD